MSDALFLPRELFSPAPAQARPAAPPPRRGLQFASGEAVAADLLDGLAPINVQAHPRPERRRTPRSAGARGVDLHIG